MAVIKDVILVVFSLMAVVSIALYVLRKIYQIGYARFGVYVQALLRFNTYIGLAAVNALFHQQGMTIFAVVMVLCIPLVNILSVLAFTRSSDMQIFKILVDLLKNPLILGSLVGGLFNLSGLSLWAGFELFLKQIALCSLPLGLMCVGLPYNSKASSGISSHWAWRLSDVYWECRSLRSLSANYLILIL